MAYEVWWALVFGFAVSAVVQAWVPRERDRARALRAAASRPVARATALGAASSSCSYAAIAIAKSLFQKGASAASALAFQFASTNLVWELGLVLWILLGWRFTLAEFVGGVVLIVLMTVLLRLFVSRRLEEEAREHAQTADSRARASRGREHAAAAPPARLGRRVVGRRAQLPRRLADALEGDRDRVPPRRLRRPHPESRLQGGVPPRRACPVRLLENVVVGPLIAVASFVCSVGNIPLAAVLWSGGISFAGVLAFIFADLIVLPIIAIYRKYYGTRFALRIVALMFVTMALARSRSTGSSAPRASCRTARPTRSGVFMPIGLDYKLVLNIVGVLLFAALIALTRPPRRDRSRSAA